MAVKLKVQGLAIVCLLVLFSGVLTGVASAAAISELEVAAREHKDSVDAWDKLGMAYAHQRRFAEALNALERALAIAPQSKHVRYHIALTTAWSGNYDGAALLYAELLQQYPDDADIRIDYGQTLAWATRFDQARAQYERVLESEPEHIEALRHLGLLTAWEGAYVQALSVLEKALTLDSENVRLLSAKAEVLGWMGSLSQASETYQQALGIEPKEAHLRVKLAQSYYWQGLLRKAQEQYLIAIGNDPGNAEAYLGLSRCYRDFRQFDEAEEVLRSAALLFPKERRISEALSEIAAQRSLSFNEWVHTLEPAIYIGLLLIMFYHIRRYRRVLQRCNFWLRGLIILGIPLLAIITSTLYSLSIWGGEYYRELQTINQLMEIINLLVLITVFITLIWLLRFGRTDSQKRILAIGAHPDDIEFGCGATLLRYRETGCHTHGLVLTAGLEGFSNGNGKSAQARIREAHASAKTLAISELDILDFPDTHLSDHKKDIKDAIESVVKRIQPDIVFTHTPHDLHSDHKTVYEATTEAVRGACTILCYENPNTPVGFQPAYYVDVADYLDDKIAALSQHKTQSGKAYISAEVVRSGAGFRGSQARIKYAEAFEVVRVLEKTD